MDSLQYEFGTVCTKLPQNTYISASQNLNYKLFIQQYEHQLKNTMNFKLYTLKHHELQAILLKCITISIHCLV